MNGGVTIGRWCAKKGARLAVAALALPWLRLRQHVPASPRVRVLTYHRFGDGRRDPFRVRVADFERQMAWVAEHRLAVSLADVQRFMAGDAPLADGAVLITIDDGCPSLCSHALPILLRHRIPAVAFVSAAEISDDERPGCAREDRVDDRITWREVRALADAGVVVGSHAWNHRSLGGMSVPEVRMQAERSREVLERKTDRPVTAFAYPFGTRADYDESAAAVLRESGYSCAFTSRHGAIRPGADPFTLPRVKVEGGEPFWMFRLLCKGGLDAWQQVDRALWRVQMRDKAGSGMNGGGTRVVQ